MTLFRQLFDPDSARLSYLVADPVTRSAALIDPVPGQQRRFARLLSQLGLQLRYVLETHGRPETADPVPLLRSDAGARRAAHSAAPIDDCDQRLQDGDRIYLGEEVIEVIHTPGATPCSVTYRWGDRLFTGDTLWIGRAGSIDGQAADPLGLYDSVHDRLFSLPGEYLVYPGHDRQGRRVSCIEQERLTNRDMRLTRDAFFANAHGAAAQVPTSTTEENKPCATEPDSCPH